MAAITLAAGEALDEHDLTAMVVEFKNIFLLTQFRYFTCTGKVETTGTFKYQKNKLKEEAFHPDKTTDRLLVLLPGNSGYKDISMEIYQSIQDYQYRF